jgi:hypothetical protein
MTHSELASDTVAAIQAGTRMSLMRRPKSKLPPGFPRGELMCENFDGTRVYSFDPARVLQWLHKTGLLADAMTTPNAPDQAREASPATVGCGPQEPTK